MRMATCHPDRKYFAKGLCQKCYSAAYYTTHKEKSKAYRVANRDRILARQTVYRTAHKEERRTKKAAWNAAHKEQVRAYRIAYRAAHLEEERARDNARNTAWKESGGGTWVQKTCACGCGMTFYVPSYRAAKANYYSVEHHNNTMRTGGTTQGYVVMKYARHPLASGTGLVFGHWFALYEAANNDGKRWLVYAKKNKWTIHHKNGKRADNRIANLELMAPGKHPKGWTLKQMAKEVDMAREAGILS